MKLKQKKEEHKTLNHNINTWACCFKTLCRAGDGLSHDIDRVHVPLPHVLEHILHSPHIPQFPFTMANKRYM